MNMIKELHFGQCEFQARLAAVKKEMTHRGIDILLLSEPPNQNYLTGYNAYSFYTPQLVIVAQDYKEPIWVGRFMDRVSASMTTYLAEGNIRAYPDTYVQSATLSAYVFMADIVKELGGEKARIGVEMGGYYYPAREHADLTHALPNAEFVDADLLVGWIRLVKSPAEVSIMRQAGQLADVAMKRVIDTVEAGVRECDIAAAIYHQQVSGTPEFGGDYPCCPPIFASASARSLPTLLGLTTGFQTPRLLIWNCRDAAIGTRSTSLVQLSWASFTSFPRPIENSCRSSECWP
ncbi:Xaa-Pro peptidase family protein (plasmid) [Rhizobium sp. T1470]|uniref:M24 family metallopeptidase n=1 Tax=Rhizobium sp. T1473 TaxID=555321 RepID=UPI0030CC89DA